MKQCTYCGKKYQDEATVCSLDQQPLTSNILSSTASTPRFAKRHPIFTVVTLSVLGGIIGFVGGIAWAWHDNPESPQAPIFGIFITGPAGLFLGVLLSVVMIIRAGRASNDIRDNDLK